MKNLLLFVLLMTFCCCAQEKSVNAYQYKQSELDTLLKYTTIIDSQYVFSLSKEEAIEKGVSVSAYIDFCISKESVNESIRESLDKGIPVYFK